MNLKLKEVGADKWFAFGAMLLVIVGCEIYTGLHVLKFLRDNALPAIGLLIFGTFCALFYTYYAMCSTNTVRSRTALALKLVLMGVMIASAVAVIVYNQQVTQLERAKVEAVAKEERDAEHENEKTKTLVNGATELDKIKDRALRRKIADKLAQEKTAEKKAVTEDELRTKAGLSKPDDGVLAGVKKGLFEFADNMAIVYVPSLINFICFCIMICVLATTATATGNENFQQPQQSPPSPPAGNQIGFTSTPAQVQPATAKQGTTTFSTGSSGNFMPPRP